MWKFKKNELESFLLDDSVDPISWMNPDYLRLFVSSTHKPQAMSRLVYNFYCWVLV